jgi:hypothetical protein
VRFHIIVLFCAYLKDREFVTRGGLSDMASQKSSVLASLSAYGRLTKYPDVDAKAVRRGNFLIEGLL